MGQGESFVSIIAMVLLAVSITATNTVGSLLLLPLLLARCLQLVVIILMMTIAEV